MEEELEPSQLQVDPLAREVLEGLTARPKRLPPKLFYDAVGSRLFERITELPEYYLTRAEHEILRDHGASIAALVDVADDEVVMIEPGCGSSTKAAAILRHLRRATYVGVDISPDALADGASALARAIPGLRVEPIPGDYTAPGWRVPPLPPGRRVAFFPGSTIGNFEPDEARSFLRRLGSAVGPGGTVVVGADPWKDPAVLRPAYDDTQGLTAAFNRNALWHLVRRYGLDFAPDRFVHQIRINARRYQLEMHLASVGAQTVHLWGTPVRFEDGETIHTESCYKWPLDVFLELCRSAGLEPVGRWTDEAGRFAVHAFTPR